MFYGPFHLSNSWQGIVVIFYLQIIILIYDQFSANAFDK